MDIVHNFQASKLVGNFAEIKVKEYFTNLGFSIQDSSEKEYYDFELIEESGKSYYIEVKYDRKSTYTNNIFWELSVESPEGNRVGWTQKYDRSDIIICFYFTDRLLLLKSDKLKDVQYDTFPIKYSDNGNWRGKGALIPLKEFEKYCTVIELNN
jgi:hypothetical protein